MDVQIVKGKLQEILNSFLSVTFSHLAYGKQSQAMTALLSKMNYESYAPVIDFTNERLLVSVAHAKKWELRS